MAHVIRRDRPDELSPDPRLSASSRVSTAEPELDELDPDLVLPPEWTTRADLGTTAGKLAAAIRGLKHAMRGESSFFVHAYRGLLLVLTGLMLGVRPTTWCLLGICGGLVLVAELCHSAIDTIARAVGDPETQALKAARDIAAAGVLIAVCVTVVVAVTMFSQRLGELLGW
jgi:diacylglycerol kinase (ATP)